jgi:hypothetical protein
MRSLNGTVTFPANRLRANPATTSSKRAGSTSSARYSASIPAARSAAF